MDVADEHGRAGLALEIIDSPAHGIDGKRKPLRRRAEATAACNFQENARRIPVGQTGERNAVTFSRNAPFHCQMHTSPLSLLNLAEVCTDYNYDGSSVLYFIINDCPMEPVFGDADATIPPMRNSGSGSMTSLVNLHAFANSAIVPLVLMVDMQQEYLAEPRLLALTDADAALANCRILLDHARRIGLPVAFMRLVGESVFFNRATPFARWIEGFEPFRNEMIFERTSPSCYACEPFAAFMDQSRGGIVMAGFAGESACLSTLIDAFHRKHKVTHLFDASASHTLDDLSADHVHRAVSTISGLYAEVCGRAEWIAATVPLKLRNGKIGNGIGTSG